MSSQMPIGSRFVLYLGRRSPRADDAARFERATFVRTNQKQATDASHQVFQVDESLESL
jgi:hypothetical protein